MDFNLAFDMGDVGARAGCEVIQDCHLVALGQQSISQVRSNEACSTCDEYAHVVKSNGGEIDSSQHLTCHAGNSQVGR